ncbi:hypothetical protein [Bosea sp. UNC402CLCol]|uniref:hypothetical protein n=1 Tax=Bosea sp. UNC402CLCol TaxID=1510531 RepID=UPI000570C75E|nr:hypothetical protein [Bosea sp. UNC402CLCol]
MGVREDIRRALYDAIDWQESLADAQRGDPEQFKECKEQARRYRAILKRRYGTSKSIAEQALEGTSAVPITELMRRNRP